LSVSQNCSTQCHNVTQHNVVFAELTVSAQCSMKLLLRILQNYKRRIIKCTFTIINFKRSKVKVTRSTCEVNMRQLGYSNRRTYVRLWRENSNGEMLRSRDHDHYERTQSWNCTESRIWCRPSRKHILFMWVCGTSRCHITTKFEDSITICSSSTEHCVLFWRLITLTFDLFSSYLLHSCHKPRWTF